jgi:hypothetical protein
MNFSEEEIKMIKNMGALGYKSEKIASIMDLDLNKFNIEFQNPESLVFKAYKTGCDRAEYVIDFKLFEMAQAGDLKAMKEYELRKRKQQR